LCNAGQCQSALTSSTDFQTVIYVHNGSNAFLAKEAGITAAACSSMTARAHIAQFTEGLANTRHSLALAVCFLTYELLQTQLQSCTWCAHLTECLASTGHIFGFDVLATCLDESWGLGSSNTATNPLEHSSSRGLGVRTVGKDAILLVGLRQSGALQGGACGSSSRSTEGSRLLAEL
jgi:hypothetical protein